MFFGEIDLYLANSFDLSIFNRILEISINLILFFINKLTRLSFALTITVSNNESSIFSFLIILITGNFFKFTDLRLKLLSVFILSFFVRFWIQRIKNWNSHTCVMN